MSDPKKSINTNNMENKLIWTQSGSHGPVNYTVRLTRNSSTNKFYISGEAIVAGTRHIVSPFQVTGNKDYYPKANTGQEICIRVTNWNLTATSISFDAYSWAKIVVAGVTVWVPGPSLRASGALTFFESSSEFLSHLKATGQTYEQVPTS